MTRRHSVSPASRRANAYTPITSVTMNTWDRIKTWLGYGVTTTTAPSYDLVSPWATSNAAQLVWADHFGASADAVTRETALQVPGVSRARALLIGTIADLPITAYRSDAVLETQPTWVSRSSGPLSPWHRMAATIDDLVFYGVSLWARKNAADGFPTDFIRIPRHRWEVDSYGRILVDGNLAPANEVTVIPGPGEGLLTAGADTIRGARAIERAWQSRVKTPIPPTLFRQVEKETATASEIQTLLNTWAAQRRNPDSAAVAFVPHGLDPVFATVADDGQLFIEGRNAIRLDVANLLNIPANMLDGSTATASLTYSTAEGNRSDFYEKTVRYWTAPIEHRLSMDDIVPRGQRVRFDISYLTPVAPDGEPSED